MDNFKLTHSDPGNGSLRRITLTPPNLSSTFRKVPGIAEEKFESGWLIFHAESMMIFALDRLGHEIFSRLNTGQSLASIVEYMVAEYDAPESQITDDVLTLSAQWEQQNLIKRILVLSEIENKDQGRWFRSKSGISCRVEGSDGAILYDRHQNVFQVLNPTGVVIWQLLSENRTVKELVYELSQEFSEIPLDDVVLDIELFLENLIQTGFVIEVFDELS